MRYIQARGIGTGTRTGTGTRYRYDVQVYRVQVRGIGISLPDCLNMTLVILSATSKYRVKTMNSRIVDMNRSFPLSKTFPKL